MTQPNRSASGEQATAGPSLSTVPPEPFRRSQEWRQRHVEVNILVVLAGLAGFATLILWTIVLDQYGSEDISTALWIGSIVTTVVAGLLVLVLYARWATALRDTRIGSTSSAVPNFARSATRHRLRPRKS